MKEVFKLWVLKYHSRKILKRKLEYHNEQWRYWITEYEAYARIYKRSFSKEDNDAYAEIQAGNMGKAQWHQNEIMQLIHNAK